MDREILWTALRWPGTEHLRIAKHDPGIVADGLIIGLFDETPFRLCYHVRCDHQWRVREARVEIIDADRVLHLIGDGAGRWTDGAGNAVPALTGCIDIDIAATPFTNTLPIRRRAWQAGESAEFSMAYIRVPELSAKPDPQRYTCLDRSANGGTFLYESLDRVFRAELAVDSDGLVIDYPGLWQRAWPE
jgi:uncharacterized protein